MDDELDSITSDPVIDLASGISAVPGQLAGKEVPYIALDISPVALRETQKIMRSRDVRGGVCQADLERMVPLAPVRAIYVLTYFYSPFLFRWVASQAEQGSVVLAETYCQGSQDSPVSDKYCLDPGELRSYYSQWEVSYYTEREMTNPETARLIAHR